MPKVSQRCKRRTHQGISPAMAASFMATPRKVSFEDNFPGMSERGPSSPIPNPLLEFHIEASKPLRKKSSLTRPKSSLSLVELAQSAESQPNSSTTAATISAAPISPLPSPRVTMPQDDMLPSIHLPGSPWGQFVDMTVPDETARTCAPQHSNGAPCSCCFSCRRRRANPYGNYRKSRQCADSTANAGYSCFFGDLDTVESRSTFRLAPRKTTEPADQLVGALDRLQFG